MNDSLISGAVAPIAHKFVELYDKGSLTLDEAKEMLLFCVDTVDDCEGNIADALALLEDRCSVCLGKFEDTQLISWDPKVEYKPGDPRAAFSKVAFNNCFGEVMVGGCVCLACARKLPINPPEPEE